MRVCRDVCDAFVVNTAGTRSICVGCAGAFLTSYGSAILRSASMQAVMNKLLNYCGIRDWRQFVVAIPE